MCFGRIAIEWGGVIERHTHRGFITLRAEEGVDQGAQPFARRSLVVFKDSAQQVARLPPLVALKSEEDRRLVREVLIERPDTDSGLLGDARRGEALRAFLSQNLNSSIQNRGDELRRAHLLGLFS